MNTNEWEKEFDEKFYQKDGVWMSRFGESYGSITPEMGRGELFRFIATLLTVKDAEIATAYTRGKEERTKEIINELHTMLEGEFAQALYSWTPYDFIEFIKKSGSQE